MSEIKQIIDTIEDVSDVFNNRLSGTEKKLLDEVLNLVKGLNTTNGRINSSVENLKLLSKIKSKLKQVVLNKDYMNAVKDLIKGMDRILASQVNYYNRDFKLSKDFKAKSKLVKELAVENTVNMLAGTGLEANVTNKINEILLRSITSGGMYADLVREMSDFLTTNENGEGALQRYARTWTTTSLNQFAGQHNKLMTDDLDIEWYEYTGSNMDTTREFCEVLREKRYIHKSEFPEIIKGNIDGHQCEIYERTGLPKGMIAGTTPENFITNRGGWNCGHQLVPVSTAMVPKEIREKVERAMAGKDVRKMLDEYKSVKSAYKPQIKETGILKLDLTLGVKDLAKETVNKLIKGWHDYKDDAVKYKILRAIISKKEFIEHRNLSTKNNSIYIFGVQPYDPILKDKYKEYVKNISIAKKMLNMGGDVYIMSNPQGITSGDFIFEKNNKIYYYEGKTLTGESTVYKRSNEAYGQADRVILDIQGVNNPDVISSEIKKYFLKNPKCSEVLIFKGSKPIPTSAAQALAKNFFKSFRKKWSR